MTDRGADIEDPPRRPAGPFALHPVDQRLPAAVGQRAQPAAGGGEDAAVVIGARRNVARTLLAMIAAGHAVNVDRALVARHLHQGVELERIAALVGLVRARIEIVDLAKHHRAAVLLAHLHRIALGRRPEAMVRIGVHRVADLEAVPGLATMLRDEGRQNACVERGLVAGSERAGEILIEVGEEVEPRGLVMRRHRRQAVAGNCGVRRGDVDLAHISPFLARRSMVSV